MSDRPTLSSLLIERRREKDLRQPQAAELIGATRARYAAWEESRSHPRPHLYFSVSAFLNISIGDLATVIAYEDYIKNQDNQLTKP